MKKYKSFQNVDLKPCGLKYAGMESRFVGTMRITRIIMESTVKCIKFSQTNALMSKIRLYIMNNARLKLSLCSIIKVRFPKVINNKNGGKIKK